MRSLFRNKKGSSLDNIWVMISFFSFAICIFVSLFLWNTLATNTDIDTEIWSATAVGTSSKQDAQDFFDGIDFWLVAVWLFIHLGVLISAFLLKSHPIIYVVGIFLTIILVYVAVPLEAAWDQVVVEPDFSTTINELPATDAIMQNFVVSEVIWGVLTLIVLAGLAKNEGFI